MKNNSKGNVLRLVFSIFLILSVTGSFARTFYISNNGNDANNGLSETASWQTLAKVNASSFQPGDQILFKKGDTFYGSLTISNSGTAANPIVISAYGTGTNPVITGFTTVTNWVSLGNNIWESATAVSTLSTCNMVVIDGKNTAMGRWPNTGYLTFESHSGSNSITDNQLSSSINWTGAEVVIRTNRFKLDRAKILAQVGGTLTFDTPTSYEPINGFGYFIQNDPRTLDQQNEWYYNQHTQKIRIFSVTKPADIQISNVENLLILNAGNIEVNGIDFNGVNTTAITNIDNKLYQNIKIINCKMQYLGYMAIKGIKCNNFLIENNVVDTSNSYGIGAAGSTKTIIRNNTIQNIGLLPGMTKNMWSALSFSSVKNVIAEYNRIINVGYHGISFHGDSIVIRNNYIDTFCQILDDGGGIYTYSGNGLKNMTDIKVTGNIIMNGKGAVDGTSGNQTTTAVGIYLDKNTTNVEVDHNSVSSCSTYGMLMNNPSFVRIHNNTFFSNNPQIRSTEFSGANTVEKNECYSNIFVSKTSDQYIWNLVSQDESLLRWGKIDSNYYCLPGNEISFSRTSQPSALYTSRSFSTWKAYLKNDNNSVNRMMSEKEIAQIVFFVNENKTEKSIPLTKPMVDLFGNKYATVITLKPYTSIILLPDPNPAKYSVEYKTICEGTQYEGWGTTGKYERTLKSATGADSVVTTYLTVNPRFVITETIEIPEGESYLGWTKEGVYTRNLNAVTGCDSIVRTNLVIKPAENKQGQIIPVHFLPANQNADYSNGMEITVVYAGLESFIPDAGDEIAVFCGEKCIGSMVLAKAIDENDESSYITLTVPESGKSQNGFVPGDSIYFRIWNADEQAEYNVPLVDYLDENPEWITDGKFQRSSFATVALLFKEQSTTATHSISLSHTSVYPNPSNGNFKVHFSELPEQGTQIRIFDLQGREIASRLAEGTIEQFNLEGQQNGTYLVSAVSGIERFMQKIIIN